MISGDKYPELIALDVRPKHEYDTGHIYGATWIPYTELESRISELETHRHHEIIVYAQCGCPLQDSAIAADILVAAGFTKVYRMAGTSPQWGFDGWIAKGYPVWFATVHNLNTTYHYDTIQAAITTPYTVTNHVIYVDAGHYHEHVIVDKMVSLIGANRETTIIDGDELGTPLSIEADHTVIQGFTLQASGNGSATHSGVLLNNTQHSKIHNMTIRNNQYGMYVLNNSNNNVISRNNFINNTSPVALNGLLNHWYEDYPKGGNYWDTHLGGDLYHGLDQTIPGSDGFSDEPFNLDSETQDKYPLMAPVGADQTPPLTVDDYVDAWHTQPYAITLDAVDYHSGVALTYYRINDGTTSTVQDQGQPFISADGASHTLEYWSRDHANNIESATVITGIKLDTLPPTGSIVIDYGSPWTNVTAVILSLSAEDATSGVATMRFSSDDIIYTAWEPYVHTKAWTLSDGDGLKTVYVQYRDHSNHITTYVDTILLDTTPRAWPIIIAGGAMYTNITTVTLTLSPADENQTISEMRFSHDNSTYTSGEPYASTKTWTLPDDDGPKTVYVQYRDSSNHTTTYFDTILLDTTPPTGVIRVNHDATYTNKTIIVLTLTADDEGSGIDRIRISDDGVWDTEPWETFSPTIHYTLPAGDEPKTVYYQIIDNARYISSTFADSIILDTTPPIGTININQMEAYTSSSSVTLTLSAEDATSGVAVMRLSSNEVTYTPWEPYTSTKTWTLPSGDGPKTVYVQYRDHAGLIATTMDTIILDTTPPHADAGFDIMVAAGAITTLDAANSSDNFLIAEYTWSFPNLTHPPMTGAIVAVNFSDLGIIEVVLSVADGAGNIATDWMNITVYPAESVYVEFLYYEPCPTCPVSQRQYDIYVHNSEVVETLEEDYGSQIMVHRIFFYSDEGLELVDRYGIGLENWNTLVINREKLVFGEFNETFVRAVLDAYLTQSAHDLAIQKVTLSTMRIGVGDVVNITVTIANLGIENETCHILVYCNESIIATHNITLIPEQQETVILLWDTTDHPLGEYRVKAAVLPVQYEGNTMNNEYELQQPVEIATSAGHSLSTMLVLAFSFGFFETFSPCLIILLSFVLSYTIGQTPDFKDNFFKIQSFGLGFIAATLLLAIAFGMFFLSMPNLQHAFTWAVSIFAMLFGFNLLGVLKLPARFSFESTPTVKRLSRNKYLRNTHIGLFILGFIFYFLDPCIAPIFVAMMPLLLQEYLGFIIFVFCVGAFLPFLGIGIFVGSVSRLVRFSYRHRVKIRAISGVILISYAIYLIIFNLLPTL
jgi:cytochrome c biogenesis protein CcdA/rhodanese-related sulfurtransferase